MKRCSLAWICLGIFLQAACFGDETPTVSLECRYKDKKFFLGLQAAAFKPEDKEDPTLNDRVTLTSMVDRARTVLEDMKIDVKLDVKSVSMTQDLKIKYWVYMVEFGLRDIPEGSILPEIFSIVVSMTFSGGKPTRRELGRILHTGRGNRSLAGFCFWIKAAAARQRQGEFRQNAPAFVAEMRTRRAAMLTCHGSLERHRRCGLSRFPSVAQTLRPPLSWSFD